MGVGGAPEARRQLVASRYHSASMVAWKHDGACDRARKRNRCRHARRDMGPAHPGGFLMLRTLLALMFAAIGCAALLGASTRGAPFDAADRLLAIWVGGASCAAAFYVLRERGE